MRFPKKYLLLFFLIFSCLIKFCFTESLQLQEGQKIKVQGRVENQPRLKNGQVYLRVGKFSTKLYSYQFDEPVHYNDLVTLVGTADPEKNLGIYTQVWLSDPEILAVKETKKGFYQQGRVIADKLQKPLKDLFPQPHANLLAGVLLGIDSGFAEDFYQKLQKSGTLHLVVASGGNLAFVINGMMFFFWQLLKINRKKALLIALVLVLFYIFMVGFQPPVVRAGIMSSLTLLAAVFGRQSDGWWFLFLSCWLMVLVNPLLLFSVSFQLSVMSTTGLFLLAPKRSKKEELVWKRVGKNLKGELQIALAAFLFTAPITWLHFQEISFWGLLVNPLVNWMIPYLMLLGTLIVFFGLVWLPLAWVFQPFCFILLDYFVRVVGFFG